MSADDCCPNCSTFNRHMEILRQHRPDRWLRRMIEFFATEMDHEPVRPAKPVAAPLPKKGKFRK